MKIKLYLATLFILGIFVLGGCSSDTPTIEPTTPTATAVPSPQATATHASIATETPVPSPTSTMEPTSTIEPTPINEAVNGYKLISIVETGEGTFSGEIYFLDYYAIEMIPDSQQADAIYNLLTKSWDGMDSEDMRMALCIEWANQVAAQTKEALMESEDELVKRFTESLLTPNFQVEELDSGELVIQNEFLTYEIVPTSLADESLLNDFYLYDQMNACRKSRLSGQLPPFPQLAVIDELMNRFLFPQEIVFTVRTVRGEVELRATNTIVAMTADEYALAQSILGN